MTTYVYGHEFLRPPPAHTLTPGALEAVESVKRHGMARRLDKEVARIVIAHGNPPRVAYEGEAVTRNARALLRKAEAAGFTARLHDLGDGCMVEGYRLSPERVGFRAWWTRGQADGATWHEPWRYEMVEDTRPIGIDQKAKTGKVGYRGAGLGTQRLSIVATPWGKPLTYTQLNARLDDYDA